MPVLATTMAKLFVSNVRSSVPQIVRSHSLHPRAALGSILSSTRSRINGIEARNPSLTSVRFMGGNNAGTAANPTSVAVREAHQLLQSGHKYLDVRTVEEFSAGHAVGATNIPYMFRNESGMIKNPSFVEEVVSSFPKDEKILVGCRSGVRSLKAATDLVSSGFSSITDVAGGYGDWIKNGLPIET